MLVIYIAMLLVFVIMGYLIHPVFALFLLVLGGVAIYDYSQKEDEKKNGKKEDKKE